MVALENISKSFGPRRVLARASLRIEPGSFVSLTGESGSGKSTLLNLISGIDRPDSGRIVVNETPLEGLTEDRLTKFRRKEIGFVFQFFNLLPGLSVGENVSIPLLLAGRSATVRGRVEEMLESVGLAGSSHRPVHELSGGEQQRVAIARALVHNPVLVMADEPTGSLDRKTGDRVLELLRSLVLKKGKTVLMATHSLRVAGFADRIVRLEDGGVADS